MKVEAPTLSRPLRPPESRRPRSRRYLGLLAVFALAAWTVSWFGNLYREIQALPVVSTAFQCTIYYTPVESAFAPGAGFDLTPETRPGLDGKTYPRDFLRAVALEGFGKIQSPVEGKAYICFNGKWSYADAPLGQRSIPLQPRLSSAVSTRSAQFNRGDLVMLRSKALPLAIEIRPWQIDDVGPWVGKNQIDLYWGEDAPSGPGEGLQRPAGIELTRVRDVRVYRIPGEAKRLRAWLLLTEGGPTGLLGRIVNSMVDSALNLASGTPGPCPSGIGETKEQ